MNVIITGATGMVGGGVLLECLDNPKVKSILMVNRRHLPIHHEKLKELIVPNFTQIEELPELSGYDACFYCVGVRAGIKMLLMKEDAYSFITHDIAIHFAGTLLKANPNMIFNFISAGHIGGSKVENLMWVRVKRKTENALMNMGFKGQYNFRPILMKPSGRQKNVRPLFRFFLGTLAFLFPKQSLRIEEVGRAMIHVAQKGYSKSILEVKDIRALSASMI